MDSLHRRTLLGGIGSLAATSALAGCIGDTPASGNGGGDGGDDGDDSTGGGKDRLRGDAVVDYPGMVDDEATVSSDERAIEYDDPDETFVLRAIASTDAVGGGNGSGSDGPAVRISRDLSGESMTAFVAPVVAGDGKFEYHVFANQAFVETADWNVVTGTQNGELEAHDGLAFEPLAAGVYDLVVDATSTDVLLVTDATVEELDGGDADPRGVLIHRVPGERVQETAPNVAFDFEYDAEAERLVVTHEGGDSVEAERLEFATDASSSVDEDFEGTVTAGTSATLSVPPSATVSVVWTSEDEGQSATLARWNGPDA